MNAKALLFALACVAACGSVDEQPKDAATDDAVSSDADTPAFTLASTTPNPSVPLGGANVIGVRITRSGGFAGEVTVAAQTPPAGLTVTPVTIAAGETTGVVQVTAAAPLVLGNMVSFTLEATGTGVASQSVTISDAPITGRPGAPDTSFGPGGGVASISLGADDDGAFRALDVIGDTVLGVGWSTAGLGAQRFISMRFTAAGTADTTWNSGTVLRTGFTGSSSESSHAFAAGRQTDGRNILIGENLNTDSNIALARTSTTGGGGGVDFGDGTGKSLVNLGGTENVTDGLVLASNQIIAVGSRNSQMFVARMSSGGLLDTTFNSPTGYATATLGGSSTATDVVLDDQDRLVVAGSLDAGSQQDLFIRRYAAAGSLDGAFGGNNGVLVTGPDSEVPVGLAVVGNKIVVASNAATSLGARIRVRRFASDGSVDSTFGIGGVAEYTPSAGGGPAVDMTTLPDGRIVVLANANGAAQLIRFSADGVSDSLFGTSGDGSATIAIGDSGEPTCVAVYDLHRVVVGGGNQGGTPGPGTFAVIARIWM